VRQLFQVWPIPGALLSRNAAISRPDRRAGGFGLGAGTSAARPVRIGSSARAAAARASAAGTGSARAAARSTAARVAARTAARTAATVAAVARACTGSIIASCTYALRHRRVDVRIGVRDLHARRPDRRDSGDGNQGRDQPVFDRGCTRRIA